MKPIFVILAICLSFTMGLKLKKKTGIDKSVAEEDCVSAFRVFNCINDEGRIGFLRKIPTGPTTADFYCIDDSYTLTYIGCLKKK